MKIKILPGNVNGSVIAPASKSMAHRYLICAGLCQGESVIKNVAYSEDILATLDCLEALGAEIEKGTDYVRIRGISAPKSGGGEYKCRESGSTLRFFIPIALLGESISCFYGSGRLMERPMTVYENLAEQKGFFYKGSSDCIEVKGPLTSGKFSLRGDISSQFISGLLFALPLCEGDSEISLTGKIESKSYIDMTLQSMSAFGVTAKWKDERTLFINGSQKYTPQIVTVEGDCSNAVFLDAFNLLGGEVAVEGLDENTIQGDSVYKEFFELLKKGTPTLDISNCPDLAPIIMSLACVLNGARLIGTGRLKIKESDRGFVMKQELSKFGADIDIYENEIVINNSIISPPKEPLYGHNDHRVVMSLAVLCSKFGGEISGAEAIRKSYPDFFEKIRSLGLEVKEYDN